MADLNIISVTNIKGRSFGNTLLTSTVDIIDNAHGNSRLVKVNNLILNSSDQSNTLNANVYFVDWSNSNTSTPIVSTLDIPAQGVIDVLSKPIYLEEGDKLTASASVAGQIGLVVSYEELS